MRFAFIALLALAIPAISKAAAPTDQQLARAVIDFSVDTCYCIASGATILPNDSSPTALEETISVVEKMGLTFGIKDTMLEALGPPGQALVSRATMASKTLDGGDIVVTFGGPQPGCRVILLSDATANVQDAVSAGLTSVGWKPVPAMTARQGAIERRALVRRDALGSPYLINLMTITDPSSKIRLITTTVRIPAGVALPPGL